MNIKTWSGRIAKTVLWGGALIGIIGASVIGWFGHRPAPPVTQAQYQQSYQRAVAWVRTHETQVLQDGNAALWWMVQTAAERTNDAYLQGLVRQSMARVYTGNTARIAWQRMVTPKAEIDPDLASLEGLSPYQLFLYHAVTCRPVELAQGDTSRFLQTNVCRPQAIEVYSRDLTCSTHQLMGIKLYERTGCPAQGGLAALEAELLSDIEQQMQLDVIVKDGYLQRVLTLSWMGGAERVKPLWVQRVLAAQQPDGGWLARQQIPEMPDGALSSATVSVLARIWPSRFPPGHGSTDFHATAQGLLIAALGMTASSAPQAALAP